MQMHTSSPAGREGSFNMRKVLREACAYPAIHEHAWCIDDRGFVVDPTWAGPTAGGLGSAYFGVVFSLEKVAAARRGSKGHASLLHDWVRDYPLLKRRR